MMASNGTAGAEDPDGDTQPPKEDLRNLLRSDAESCKTSGSNPRTKILSDTLRGASPSSGESMIVDPLDAGAKEQLQSSTAIKFDAGTSVLSESPSVDKYNNVAETTADLRVPTKEIDQQMPVSDSDTRTSDSALHKMAESAPHSSVAAADSAASVLVEDVDEKTTFESKTAPMQQPSSAPAPTAAPVPSTGPPATAAPRIMMVQANTIDSLRGKVPSDLNVLAHINPQSGVAEFIVGVFDRNGVMLGVDEAIRKFAEAPTVPAAVVTSATSQTTSVEPEIVSAASLTAIDESIIVPVCSGSTAVPVATTTSSAFMPLAAGYIMTPPAQRPSSDTPPMKLHDAEKSDIAVRNAAVAKRPSDNKGGIFRVKTNTPSKAMPIFGGNTSRMGVQKFSEQRSDSAEVDLGPKSAAVVKPLKPVFGSSVFKSNFKPSVFPGIKKPANKITLLTSLAGKKSNLTTASGITSSLSRSKPPSPASSQNISLTFTLPKNVADRIGELKRVSQRVNATLAEREAATTEMGKILDEHRHAAFSVMEGDGRTETRSAVNSPVEATPSPADFTPIILSKRPAAKRGAARKLIESVGDKPATDAAGKNDGKRDSSLVDVKPAIPATTRPFLVKRPGISDQVVASEQPPASSTTLSSSATTAGVAKTKPRSRVAAQKAKRLMGVASATFSVGSPTIPVNVDPAEMPAPTLVGKEPVLERKMYTTVLPKRKAKAAVLPAKSSPLARNASSSNLSSRSDNIKAGKKSTPVKPVDDVFSPRSDASRSRMEENSARDNSIPTEDGDDANGLIIDDDLSQSVASRLRRRKSSAVTSANSITPPEEAEDDATRFAQAILNDDAELQKFFAELDDHLNDEFGADSGIVDDYYGQVSARVDVECQLDEWTTKIISPPPSDAHADNSIIKKEDIFGPSVDGGNEDDDLDDVHNYCETRLVRKRAADQMENSAEDADVVADSDLSLASDAAPAPPLTAKQKARCRAKNARARAKTEQPIDKFIDCEISRIERHLVEMPTWEECGESPEQVLMRFHLLQEGNCVRWARVRGHVLPLPYKLPYDVAETELKRQDGLFETISHDLISRKQRLLETGKTMLLNDQMKKRFDFDNKQKKHQYGALEEHCILLRGLMEADERELQNIRQEHYNIQTALYAAYGPYVSSYTMEMQAAAVASLSGVGPAARPEDIKHYADWFETHDLQLQQDAAADAVAIAVTTTSADLPTLSASSSYIATTHSTTYEVPAYDHSTLPSADSNLSSMPQDTSHSDLSASASLFYSAAPSFVENPSASMFSQQSSAATAPAVSSSQFVDQEFFNAGSIFNRKLDEQHALSKQESIEEDLPSTPPPPILERMAETPSSLRLSPTKSVALTRAAVAPSVAESSALESAVMSSFYNRLATDTESTARRNVLSSTSSAPTREPREQVSSAAANSRGPVFDAASIFGDADVKSSQSNSSGRSSLNRRRSSLMGGSSHTDYTEVRGKRSANDDVDYDSDDVSLPQLEVEPQEEQRGSRRNSRKRRRDSFTVGETRATKRRRASSRSESSNEDQEEDEETRSSMSSASKTHPPAMAQLRQSTPPPTKLTLTLKRAPLVSEASISSRTRNRRTVGVVGAGGKVGALDGSTGTETGGWSVTAVAATAGKTKPSSTASSGSTLPKADKPERKKRRRWLENLEEDSGSDRNHHSPVVAEQQQKRYGTRLAAKTIVKESKVERKDRRRERRRRHRRRNDSGSEVSVADSDEGEHRLKISVDSDDADDIDDGKKSPSSEAGQPRDDAATPPPLLEPMLGGGNEETSSSRTKTTRHVQSATKAKPLAARISTSGSVNNTGAGPSWLDSVFGDSGGRLSSSSRHHPQTHHRHPSGNDIFRSSATHNTNSGAAAGNAASRLDTNDDDDAVFESNFDALLGEEFDFSTILSENEMHNLLITSSSAVTPTFGSSSVITSSHHHHMPTDSQSVQTGSHNHHHSVMISQGSVFSHAPAHFMPPSQQTSNIPNPHPQVFTYSTQQPLGAHDTGMISQPVLHIPTASGAGTSGIHGGVVLSYAGTTGGSVMPPVLTASYSQLASSTPSTTANVSVASFPATSAALHPPPLSTTNLDAIFLPGAS